MMKRCALIALCTALLSKAVTAFTNGTLLPAYLCGAQGDGYPKSLGTMLPYLVLGTDEMDNAYDNFPPGFGGVPILNNNQTLNATNFNMFAVAPFSTQILGSFHNGMPPANPVTPTKNPVWLAPSTADFATGQGTYEITPGAVHNFTLAVHIPDGAGFNPTGVALDGAFIYALDTATGLRIGAWKNAGPAFSAWSACNLNQVYNQSVGIVHNQVITDNSNIAGLLWIAPPTIKGTVKFIGAGVTDSGYGPFSVEYNTTTNLSAPSVTTQGLVANTNAADTAAAPFVNADAAPDLPFNVLGTNVACVAALQQPATTPAPATKMVTQGAAAGIGIGMTIVGILIGAAGAFVFLKSKKGGVNEPLMMKS